ncbi:MAG: proline iminopeptidase, partial [Pedobacter sp.]|nr:proline iminopeptidase [Pedobacter sp.]
MSSKNIYSFIAIAISLLFISCNHQTTDAEYVSYFNTADTGVLTGGVKIIPIQTPKGKFNVWTKRIGNNPKIKLLLLNGGPGATHEYFECMENFLPKEGIEFIYYDQLGCGNSDNPKDTA